MLQRRCDRNAGLGQSRLSAGSAAGQALAGALISGPGLVVAQWSPAPTLALAVVAAALSGRPFGTAIEVTAVAA
jgi:hypothetical protein